MEREGIYRVGFFFSNVRSGGAGAYHNCGRKAQLARSVFVQTDNQDREQSMQDDR